MSVVTMLVKHISPGLTAPETTEPQIKIAIPIPRVARISREPLGNMTLIFDTVHGACTVFYLNEFQYSAYWPGRIMNIKINMQASRSI